MIAVKGKHVIKRKGVAAVPEAKRVRKSELEAVEEEFKAMELEGHCVLQF